MTDEDDTLLPTGGYRGLRAPARSADLARERYVNAQAAPRVTRYAPLAFAAACVLVLAVMAQLNPEDQGNPEPALRAPHLSDLKLPARPSLPALEARQPSGTFSAPRLSQLNLTKLKTMETRS